MHFDLPFICKLNVFYLRRKKIATVIDSFLFVLISLKENCGNLQ